MCLRSKSALGTVAPHALHRWVVPLGSTGTHHPPAHSALQASACRKMPHEASWIDFARFPRTMFLMFKSSCATRSNRSKRLTASLREKSSRWLRECSYALVTRSFARMRELLPRFLVESEHWRQARTASPCRKKRGFSTASPFERTAKLVNPRSIPTAVRTDRFGGAVPRSQARQIFQRPACR